MNPEGIPFILSAPSGTGKTTICRMLKERLPDLKLAVSHTTRPPRKGEIDARDYFFISRKQFQDMIEKDEFLEWAPIHNNLYGTSFQTLEDNRKKGRDTLLELDVQGVETLREKKVPGVYIFILPPSIEELLARLRSRGTESEEIIQQRVETGKIEIKKYRLYDYVATNFDSKETTDVIISIIRAEKNRVARFRPVSPDIQSLFNNPG